VSTDAKDPRIEDLVDALTRSQHGDAWHGPSVSEAVGGVAAQDAREHPIDGAHSIWEIALHIRGWRLEVARRAVEGGQRDPAGGDWPALPSPADNAAWATAVESLAAATAHVIEVVRALPPARLDELPVAKRDPALGTGMTVGRTLWGVVQHDIYHAGQVVLLRRALEARRPGGGTGG
jgi:uncharacterized damage-inducible protein DinB